MCKVTQIAICGLCPGASVLVSPMLYETYVDTSKFML